MSKNWVVNGNWLCQECLGGSGDASLGWRTLTCDNFLSVKWNYCPFWCGAPGGGSPAWRLLSPWFTPGLVFSSLIKDKSNLAMMKSNKKTSSGTRIHPWRGAKTYKPPPDTHFPSVLVSGHPTPSQTCSPGSSAWRKRLFIPKTARFFWPQEDPQLLWDLHNLLQNQRQQSWGLGWINFATNLKKNPKKTRKKKN